MKWEKLGNIFNPEHYQHHEKLLTHASNPLPIRIDSDIYRVFYSGRDADNKSSVGAVDIDIIKREVVKHHHEPFFLHGNKSSFFEHGVSIGNCFSVDGKNYILFMGWQTYEGQHWRGDVGCLIVNNDLTLSLFSDIPFMGVDEVDTISLSYPWVMKNEIGLYQMWYGSTITWNSGNGEMIHTINYAHSIDGFNWKKEGLAVPYELNIAQAFSRPTVVKDNDSYKMWFSYRGVPGLKYRIGYAESKDGIKWIRKDEEAGIDVSESGWDSEMICYPFVFDHGGERYMLYNGNRYGKTGFGLAVLRND